MERAAQQGLFTRGLVMQGSRDSHSLVIGDQRVKVDAISRKIEQDIAFLRERIWGMKNQSNPNTVVLKTYETMLESRLSVLKWLEDYCPDQTDSANQSSKVTQIR